MPSRFEALQTGAYSHWGVNEPNNFNNGDELCAIADQYNSYFYFNGSSVLDTNKTEAYVKKFDRRNLRGWSDFACVDSARGRGAAGVKKDFNITVATICESASERELGHLLITLLLACSMAALSRVIHHR